MIFIARLRSQHGDFFFKGADISVIAKDSIALIAVIHHRILINYRTGKIIAQGLIGDRRVPILQTDRISSA
ncbi:hypothetical protein SDC9_72939 [bioreactor metagenome]|uniref:Uncharacterized protein n=1 Tax=bioreactor metagenome TaxID=1076179 RepID=A0A644YDX7_9ZZZZ